MNIVLDLHQRQRIEVIDACLADDRFQARRHEPEVHIPPRTSADHAEDTSIGELVGRNCLLYTSPSTRDRTRYRLPSSA